MCWGREVTLRASPKFGQLSDTFSQKIANCISSKHVIGPRIITKVDEFILHACCNILDWNNSKLFHQIQVGFNDFRKVQHKFLTKLSKLLNNFQCYINIHVITSRRGKILNRAKSPAWAFRFWMWSFSMNALRCQWNWQFPFFFLVVSDQLYWVVEICQQDMPSWK